MILVCDSKKVVSYLNYNHFMLCQIQQSRQDEPFIVIKNYRKNKNIQRKISVRKRSKQVPPITIKTRRMQATDVRQTSIIHQGLLNEQLQNHSLQQEIFLTPRQNNIESEQRAEFQMKEMQYPPLINQSLGFDIDNLLGYTGSKVNQDVELLE